ncbi:MAG: cation diffusion facilitator family transporter [Thermodesulfovibrionales bacterium]|nr:cation diffusion facilitator family transporter [Thermodesulfovibrionales bacterium]
MLEDSEILKRNGKKYFNRITEIKKVLLITLFLNLFVSIIKIVYGYFINSLSILSDGFHSLFDGVSNIVGLIGIYLSSQPPDEKHPYGHRKYETLFTIFIGLLMFLTCIEIFKRVYDSFVNKHTVEITTASFLIMVITMFINMGVTRYEIKKGRELKSEYLIADSQHTKMDIFISVGVIFSLVLTELGFVFVDIIAGAIVGLLVAKAGIQIVKDASETLVDKTKIDKREIKEIINKVEGVRGCHGIRTRGTANHVFLDLHLLVDPLISVHAAHDIAHQAEEEIKKRFPEVIDVVVHIEPSP